ncbi:MAG TPA: redoxin domain-containing protein [Armatimonadota bacterium]|nr:redoxin domain-containing protein [Armatimonadota bacterium]
MKVRMRAEGWLLVGFCVVAGLVGVDLFLGQMREAREAAASARDAVLERESRADAKPSRPTTGTEDALPVGSPAPDFTLADLDGRPRSLSEFKGHTTVLAFYCGCGRCAMMAQLLTTIEEQVPGEKPRNLAVTSIKPTLLPEWQKSTGFKGLFLPEETKGRVATQYRGEPCPRLYVLDPELRIRHVTPTPKQDRPASDILNPLARALGSTWVTEPPRGRRAQG